MASSVSSENIVERQHIKSEPELIDTSANICVDQRIFAGSKVANFYRNRSVLITGASGFIGKVLIEKLLRTFSDMRHIFVLVRPKWNKQPHERVTELLGAPLYDRVRAQEDGRKLTDRIVVVEGDVTKPNLGMSDENLARIMDEVTVIYHSAATVKFDEPLKQSVGINITGTKHMIDLCRKIPKLAALVHVSTAYANCEKDEVDEHIYPVDIDPQNLMDIAGWLDQDTLQELKLKLLGPKPNTYTYTKALSEWLLVKIARDLPLVICRPSIVVASWQEPFCGWIDNVNGPTGVILGAGKGLVRSMYAHRDCVADLVPVDTVINMIITLGWFAYVYHIHKRMAGSSSGEFISESVTGSSSGVLSMAGDDTEPPSLDSFEERMDSLREQGIVERESIVQNRNEKTANDVYNNQLDTQHDVDSVGDSNNNDNNQDNHNNNDMFYGNCEHNNILSHNDSDRLRQESMNNELIDLHHHAAHEDKCYQLSISVSSVDDGYGSASRSPDAASTTYSSSKCLSSTSQLKRTKHDNGKNDQPLTICHQSNFSPETQYRLADQKEAADLDRKLKQFRRNLQARVASKNLAEDLADIPVFHCTSGSENPITWGRIQVLILLFLAKYPSISTYRYPCGSFTKNKPLDDFYRATLHYIPAYIVDFITRITGGKPVLVKIFRKFDQAAKVLKTFTSRQWTFKRDNRVWLLKELLSEEDRQLFNFDLAKLDWIEFLKNYVIGTRQFMLKEPRSNLKQAQTNLKRVYYRNLGLQVLFVAMIAYYFLQA